jgi:hypothetical protein
MATAGPLRIGNGQGFWGDDVDAPLRLARSGAVDVLTLDYLAEVTLSVLAKQKRRDPSAGFAHDFVDVVAGLAASWREGSPLAVIANAGGLNLPAAVAACRRKLAGLTGFPVGAVSGDDLMPEIDRLLAAGETLANLETGRPLSDIRDRLVSANAYLGAGPIAEALSRGARLVLTGRVADPSLALAAAMHRFGWAENDWDRLAGGTVAGHVIECGTQATGGIATRWMDLPDVANLGYPVAEVAPDGSFAVSKPAGTGGAVTVETVKEQLLYEIGDPRAYISPDVVADFTTLSVRQAGPDRVAVAGATGRPATGFYKVSAAYSDGWTASGTLTIFGRDCVAKARRAGEAVRRRLAAAGAEPAIFHVECLGAGACVPGVLPEPASPPLMETVLRLTAADPRREVVERFAKEIVPLVTTGPQGVTGYFSGRPAVREVLSYWPCLVSKSAVRPVVEVTTG